ncbi:MAG: hypothetical protein GY754_10910 [bacterium]|nr:hypothetical protein [bacterium]
MTLDLSIGDIQITGSLLPYYQGSRVPGNTSRWGGAWTDLNAVSTSGSIQYSIKESNRESYLENTSYFLRIKAPVSGWDFFLSLYHGNNSNWVLKRGLGSLNAATGQFEINFAKEIINVFNAAAGFSTTIKNWEFHGETLYNYAYSARDDQYIDSVIGVRYIFDDIAKKIYLDTIKIALEYAKEFIIKKQDAQNFDRSSRDLRVGKNDLIGSIVFNITEKISLQYLLHCEFTDKGFLNVFGTEILFLDDFKLRLGVQLFNGKQESYHGKWNNCDRSFISLEYAF